MATRARGSGTTPRLSTQTNTTTVIKLPEYQAPQFALNPVAQHKLARLFAKHDFSKLQVDFGVAVTTVTDSVAEINDQLSSRRDRIERRKARKRKAASQETAEDGQDVAQDEDIVRNLQVFTEKIEKMTKRMDESVRKMIDGQQGLASTNEALTFAYNLARQNASTQATTQPARTPRQNEGTGDEDEEEEDEDQDITPTVPEEQTQTVTGALKVFNEKSAFLKTQYQDRSLVDRYSNHNDYKNFRGLLHEAQFPDGSVVLPPPDAWFDDGVLARPGETRRGADDDDEDIQISRATTSTKCPITLQEFREPLTSRKCNHTFEKSAIQQMIKGSERRIDSRPGPGGRNVGGKPAVACPVASCESILELADLYVDAAVMRRIKRLQQRSTGDAAEGRRNRDATLIDDDEDNGDEMDIDDIERDEVVPSTMPVKKEIASSRRGR